jgi:hypothetical protein
MECSFISWQLYVVRHHLLSDELFVFKQTKSLFQKTSFLYIFFHTFFCRCGLASRTPIYDARAVSMSAQHDMTYEAACLLLDQFCAHARTSLPAHDLTPFTALLDTLDSANDCVHEYSRLRALADLAKWGKEMRFCADTALRLLAEALAHFTPLAATPPTVQHVPALIRRIQDGLKSLRLSDDLAQLALHA